MPLASKIRAAGVAASAAPVSVITVASIERSTSAAGSLRRPPRAPCNTTGPETTGVPGEWRSRSGGVGSPRRLVSAPSGELVTLW